LLPKLSLFLIITLFYLINNNSAYRLCTFYNSNNFGPNNLVSKCVEPNGNIIDNGVFQTNGRGDGKGIIGNDRVIVVGECLFASNDLDQTLTHFRVDQCAPNTPNIIGKTLVQELSQNCKQSIDDMSLAITHNQRCLLVGMGDILEANNLYAFELDLNNCSLTKRDKITAPNWLTILPYRINGITVSEDDSVVGVSFTSGFGAQAFVNFDSTSCTFNGTFNTVRDSIQPGLSTRSLFTSDSNGKNILISTVADNNLNQGTLDVRPLDSFSNQSNNPFLLPSIVDSVTLSAIFNNSNGERFLFVGEAEGSISVVRIGDDGIPVLGSDVHVANLTTGGRITGIQISDSSDLVVSQSSGFSIFQIDPLTMQLTLLGNYLSPNNNYGNSAILQMPRCCWNGSDAIEIIANATIEFDCAEDQPNPDIQIESQHCQPTTSINYSTEASMCGALPNILVNFTASTCCDRYSKTFIQRLVRVDSSPPAIFVVNEDSSTTNKRSIQSFQQIPNYQHQQRPYEEEIELEDQSQYEDQPNYSTYSHPSQGVNQQQQNPHHTKTPIPYQTKTPIPYHTKTPIPYQTKPPKPYPYKHIYDYLGCKNMSECQFIDDGFTFVETSDDCSNLQTVATTFNINKNSVCDAQSKIYATGEITFTASDSCGNTRNATQSFHLRDVGVPKVKNFEPEVILSICEDLNSIDEGENNICNHNCTDSCTNVTCELIKVSNHTNLCEPIHRKYLLTDECGNKSEYNRVFKRKETMNHQVARKKIEKIEESDICLQDSHNITYGFFDTNIPCVNPQIVVHPPVTVVNSTCFSLQIHCRTIKTECVELCSCIPLRINSLPIKLHTDQLANIHQQDLNLMEELYTFTVNHFKVPSVITPCGEPFDPNDFISKGGNITVVYFVVGEIQLIEESISIYNYKRELRIVYLFDNGCDYEMIPTAESFFVVQGTKNFLENLFVPSFHEFQLHLYETLGITHPTPTNSKSHLRKRTTMFKAQTGRFSTW
jgi:hypothetical protein